MMTNKRYCYQISPEWTAQTGLPLYREINTSPADTWTKLSLLQGTLCLDLMSAEGDVIEKLECSVEQQPKLIEPNQSYRIANYSNDLRCQLAFYCIAQDFVNKKYALTSTHSEVVAASKLVPIGKALDFGCGSGRNSLYLNLLGFDVDAVDISILSIEKLRKIIDDEQLNGLQANVFDINTADWKGEYDFIISTVVMMFLQEKNIPRIIQNMQSITKLGGYNLIVSAMSTADYPCNVGFFFTFKEGELANYYRDWSIIKYNENIGELHRKDENGCRIKLRFATLLAQKMK